MKLFLVHCGYYDPEIGDGVYEFHTNYFVVASGFDEARAKAKLLPEFKKKRMHVDGLQQVDAVDGFRIDLKLDDALQGKSEVVSHRFRDLAPKKPTESPLH